MRELTPLMRAQVRAELKALGVDRVRRAMVAFEHRETDYRNEPYHSSHGGTCCFLSHVDRPIRAGLDGAFFSSVSGRELVHQVIDRRFGTMPLCEQLFEYYVGQNSRELLRAECVAFLAEHDQTVENAHHGGGLMIGMPPAVAHIRCARTPKEMRVLGLKPRRRGVVESRRTLCGAPITVGDRRFGLRRSDHQGSTDVCSDCLRRRLEL